METMTETSPVMQKTKELCQTILDQPNMQSIRQRINAFMTDDKTRSDYDSLVNKGQTLQEKQQSAQPLSHEEIADFEKHRDALMNNPTARGFLDAQEELHDVQQSIHHYVTKTLELGRIPTEEELNSHCGNHGHGSCGCGH